MTVRSARRVDRRAAQTSASRRGALWLGTGSNTDSSGYHRDSETYRNVLLQVFLGCLESNTSLGRGTGYIDAVVPGFRTAQMGAAWAADDERSETRRRWCCLEWFDFVNQRNQDRTKRKGQTSRSTPKFRPRVDSIKEATRYARQ